MTAPDVDHLARRLAAIIRSANRIRPHLADLHSIGWEPTTPDPDTRNVDTDRRGKTDWTPRAGDPRARRLLTHLDIITTRAATDLAAAAAILDRLLDATRPIYIEQPRGTLISRPDLEAARQAQQRRRARGEYVPVPLVDQPNHPNRGHDR